MAMTEPHVAADMYFTALEMAYERAVAHATCGECESYNDCPVEWAKVPCGWCADDWRFVERDQAVAGFCEHFGSVRR